MVMGINYGNSGAKTVYTIESVDLTEVCGEEKFDSKLNQLNMNKTSHLALRVHIFYFSYFFYP